VVIGTGCIIHQISVIGCDGFGNARDEYVSWTKIPQLGRVIIEVDVEIGSGKTVVRGAIDDTLIINVSRLDNFVHIANNV
ncbi:UDP-3-O-(3-hydroxymyristoyl)glucosamine N-acyltransferase, partial [Francisella tularensis subsp. holarctica]|nr:UDP-3-O-(3-hydroxymyristoyl)glucosamine N-acyltransferase [Francisella tularensis subsp. holarctica]